MKIIVVKILALDFFKFLQTIPRDDRGWFRQEFQRFLRSAAVVFGSNISVLAIRCCHTKTEIDSNQTFVARKQNGEWYFAAFHNNRIRSVGIGTIAEGIANLIWQRIRLPQ